VHLKFSLIRVVVSFEGGNSAKITTSVHLKSDMIRVVVSLEGGNSAKIYYLSAFEIWHDKSGVLS
jgi:monomeric isocitrate dehydrogenase